jgi:hypothetical protein
MDTQGISLQKHLTDENMRRTAGVTPDELIDLIVDLRVV